VHAAVDGGSLDMITHVLEISGKGTEKEREVEEREMARGQRKIERKKCKIISISNNSFYFKLDCNKN